MKPFHPQISLEYKYCGWKFDYSSMLGYIYPRMIINLNLKVEIPQYSSIDFDWKKWI